MPIKIDICTFKNIIWNEMKNACFYESIES